MKEGNLKDATCLKVQKEQEFINMNSQLALFGLWAENKS